MRLDLINLTSRTDNWSVITLHLNKGDTLSPPKFSILETDQFFIRLHLDDINYESNSAKLIIGDLEIHSEISNGICEWHPNKNIKYGYDAIFLHFFGYSELAVEIIIENDSKVFLFEKIEIYGRKVTAERASEMLDFISNNIDEHILRVLSPTSYLSKIVRDGVSPSDMLNRLENIINDLEISIKEIIVRPLTSLRNENELINHPKDHHIDDKAIEWLSEYSGLSFPVHDQSDGVFFNDFKWWGVSEVVVTRSIPSTDIIENQMVFFYLMKFLSVTKSLVQKCDVELVNAKKQMSANQYGYVSFNDISNKKLSSINSVYKKRAMICVQKTERMILEFNKRVRVSTSKVNCFTMTEKIKSNRSYLSFFSFIRSWIELKEINWVEGVFLSSINSVPKLFEYYCVMLVNFWLKSYTGNNSNGLFNGVVKNISLSLFYEPSYNKINTNNTSSNFFSAESGKVRGRRPDIVIEYYNENTRVRKLIILDAKCRGEYSVLRESLPECMLKYGYGIRDAYGENPVTCVVMLHPKPSGKNDDFIDFYHDPFNLFGSSTAFPIAGCQRINIEASGKEIGFSNFMERAINVLLN